MRQMRHSARALTIQSVGRVRRVERFRRRAWSPRPSEIALAPKIATIRTTLPGEFPEAPRPSALRALRRVVGLASDITLLVLLSPFFIVWFLYRVAMRLMKRPSA